ncbi:MAG TPA: hypothetical protein VJY62_16290 [Bacteroidia bacterium]|nr:hypothetical protein [Bacteroidia bacterium]
MFSHPNMFHGSIKSTVSLLFLLFLICSCFNSFAEDIAKAKNQAKIFQAPASLDNDIINIRGPGVPAIAFKTKSCEKVNQSFQNKNIFNPVSFSKNLKSTVFNYLQDEGYCLRSAPLRLHLALRVLLI